MHLPVIGMMGLQPASPDDVDAVLQSRMMVVQLFKVCRKDLWSECRVQSCAILEREKGCW